MENIHAMFDNIDEIQRESKIITSIVFMYYNHREQCRILYDYIINDFWNEKIAIEKDLLDELSKNNLVYVNSFTFDEVMNVFDFVNFKPVCHGYYIRLDDAKYEIAYDYGHLVNHGTKKALRNDLGDDMIVRVYGYVLYHNYRFKNKLLTYDDNEKLVMNIVNRFRNENMSDKTIMKHLSELKLYNPDFRYNHIICDDIGDLMLIAPIIRNGWYSISHVSSHISSFPYILNYKKNKENVVLFLDKYDNLEKN